jgi:NitT/TauT family transport system permease protein
MTESDPAARMPLSLIAPLVALGVILALWVGLAAAMGDPRLPGPGAVLAEVAATAPLFLQNTALTMAKAGLGLLLAVAVGFGLALLMVSAVPVRAALMPFVIAAQSIPLIAIAPLLALWLGEGFPSHVVVAAFLCWFPTAINATRGMLQLDPVHVQVFSAAGASRRAILSKLRIPNSVPYLYAGIRISAGLAMIGAIIAEYSPVGSGLGQLVFMESLADQRNHSRLFGAVLFAAFAGWALAEGASFLFRRLFARYLPATV